MVIRPALTLAQRARELRPEDPRIADTLGWIYYKKRAYSTAVTMLKESSENLQNKNPTVLYHLGMAYFSSTEKSLAREVLNKALGIDPGFPEAKEARTVLAQIEAEKEK